MNTKQLTPLLEDLNDKAWQSLSEGQALIMVDDQALAIGSPDQDKVLFYSSDTQSPAALREQALAGAGELLGDYYRANPLTEAGYQSQLLAHIKAHGAAAFAAPLDTPPAMALFVNGGEILALPETDPRHRYGAFLELEQPMDPAETVQAVKDWAEKGEAFQQYLGMTMCRYNCS